MSNQTLSAQEFRKELLRYIAIQSAIIAFTFTLTWVGASANRPDIELLTLVASLVATLVSATRFTLMKPVSARIRDLHPTTSEKFPLFLAGLFTVPLFALVILFYLARKQRGESRPAKLLSLPLRHLLFTSLLTLTLILSFPILQTYPIFADRSQSGVSKWSYWLTTPTLHYITSVSDEVQGVLIFKKSINDRLGKLETNDLIVQYSTQKQLEAPGYLLLESLVAANTMKIKEGRTTSGTSDSSLALPLIRSSIALLENWSTTPSPFAQFNPLSLLSPAALTEIYLVSLVSLVFEMNMQAKMEQTISTIMQRTQDQWAKSNAKNPGLAELNLLRARLETSKAAQLNRFFSNHWAGKWITNLEGSAPRL